MRISKDQRGIGHVIEIVIIALIVLGVGGFIAWRVWGAQQSNSPSPSSSNSSAQTALQEVIAKASCAYADQDLCKFMTGWKFDADFSAESTSTVNGETTKTTYVSVEKGAKTHLSMTVEGKPFEVIIMGTTRYSRTADGTWWKETIENRSSSDANAGASSPTLDEPSATDAPDKTSYRNLGTEACGKLTCFKYQIVSPDMQGAIQYIWFDNKGYQMRRFYSESSDGKFDQVYTYENVSVEAPASSQNLPTGKYIIPGADSPAGMSTGEGL